MDTKRAIKSGRLMKQTNYSNYIQSILRSGLYIETQTQRISKLKAISDGLHRKLKAISDGLHHPRISSCRIGVRDKVVQIFCKCLYMSNRRMRACVRDDRIIAVWALRVLLVCLKSGNISNKLLHIFARIIVCLVSSFCCVATC